MFSSEAAGLLLSGTGKASSLLKVVGFQLHPGFIHLEQFAECSFTAFSSSSLRRSAGDPPIALAIATTVAIVGFGVLPEKFSQLYSPEGCSFRLSVDLSYGIFSLIVSTFLSFLYPPS